MKNKQLSLILLLLTFVLSNALLGQTTHNVTVGPPNGPNGGFSFVDATSGTSTTTINVGDTVTWTFATCSHTVTSTNPSFDSGFVNCGQTFSHTYTSAGTFGYFCTPHQAIGMVGTVVVNAAAPSAAFSTNTLSFTSIQIGFAGPRKTVTFTNSGSVALSMSSLVITGDFSQTNNCANPLPANQSCIITITFTPTATGTRTGSLTHSSASAPVQLTGTIMDNVINPTRPTRLHPPPPTSSNNLFSPFNLLVALAGFLLLIRVTAAYS
jgi:hypothetical protein